MPAQFVKVSPLQVLLALNNLSMFLQGDGTLGTVLDLWPEAFWNKWPGQPVHSQAEVVQLAQVHVRADSPGFNRLQQTLGLSSDEGLVADGIQGLVFGSPKPAFFRCSEFGFHERIQCVLPSAGGHAGICSGQISFGDLQVERRLAKGLVLVENHLRSRVTVLSFQTVPPPGFRIDTVKGAPAFAAVNQSETELHKRLGSLEEKLSE